MKTLKQRTILAVMLSGLFLGCGKECKVTDVNSTGSPSHTHSSPTIFEGAQTYSGALTSASAGAAHDHDITLTDSNVSGMASGRIDVTSTSTNSHNHTSGIACESSGIF